MISGLYFSISFSYVIPVLILSVILNIPKFMETKFTWTPLNSGAISSNSSANSSGDQEIEYAIGLGVSDLREDPDYIRFYINWTRLITTGLIPMGALIYFNFGIFRGIQVSVYTTHLQSCSCHNRIPNLLSFLLGVSVMSFSQNGCYS